MVIILKEVEETRSLLIYDEHGDFIAEIVSPQGYTFISLKKSALFCSKSKTIFSSSFVKLEK